MAMGEKEEKEQEMKIRTKAAAMWFEAIEEELIDIKTRLNKLENKHKDDEVDPVYEAAQGSRSKK